MKHDAATKPPYRESAGVREICLAYLPEDVGEAISVLTSYLYDKAIEEGRPLPGGYIVHELRAVGRDLAYLTARTEALAEDAGTLPINSPERPLVDAAMHLASELRDASASLEKVGA